MLAVFILCTKTVYAYIINNVLVEPVAYAEAEIATSTASESLSEPLAPQMDFETTEGIKSAIALKSKASGLNSGVMLAIAKAESRYRNVPNYKYTSEKGYYTAYGIFQITRTTYRAFCGDPAERLDVEKNIDCAMKIAKTSGLHHWDESAYAWK